MTLVRLGPHVRNAAIFVASLVIMSLKPVLLHRAQAAGADPLDPRFFVFLSEAFKVAISAVALLWRRVAFGPFAAHLWVGPRHSLAFALPAVVYLVMNSLTVRANVILTPGAFQLLANMKIMCTAIAGWVVLARPLRPAQWVALSLLTCSTVLGQWGGQDSGGEVEVTRTTLAGFLIMFTCCWLSALGAVLTEKLLKARDSHELSIFATNIHMAGQTLLLNGAFLGLSFVSGSAGELAFPRLSGAVVPAVVNEAVNGLLLSSIMRFADSNVKNYAFSVSVFTTAAVSIPIFGYRPQPAFLAGAVLVVVSMVLYTKRWPEHGGPHRGKA
mmetsp:Transcript_81861/g.228066  ORF Transcript_81861/g.228066 Transcript_81861/m.228066 type:complete len:328 (+) Transcript_81861:141-1124(+)